MGIPVPVLVIRIEIRRLVINGPDILRPVSAIVKHQFGYWLKSGELIRPTSWVQRRLPFCALFGCQHCFAHFRVMTSSRTAINARAASSAKAIKQYLGTIEA